VPDQQSAVEAGGKILSQPFCQDNLVHAGAERGMIHIKRCQAGPCDVRGKLNGAVAGADELTQGFGQPAAVPLHKDRGTRDRRCFQQATHAAHYAPPPGRRRGGAATPHDSVFRRIFGVPANAASQLRAVLPPALAGRLDLGRLAPVPGSFVDEALRWRHSDVLFTAPLDGQDAFVYVLVEHQSSDDPLMAFRVLRYVTRIWDQYEREHPGTRQLPAVIPLVVYQGPGRWASPVQLLDVIDLDPDGRQAVLVTLLLLKSACGNPQITADPRRRRGPWQGPWQGRGHPRGLRAARHRRWRKVA
jgi:Putative transposase, YhgA-like